MKTLTNSPLPPLYAGWFDDLLEGDIPSETRATCNDCAMCDSNIGKRTDQLYDPRTKCCTYLPTLPNFIVGMILSDDDPAMTAGRTSIEKRIQAGLAVTPRGLEWPIKLKAQYHQMETQAFGRAQNFKCPHYVDKDGGSCGIWKYRNSICSTWFCKYVRGAVGREFWETVKQLLMSIEVELSRWCAAKLKLDESALQLLLAPRLALGQIPILKLEELEDRVDADEYQRTWANWASREREFYVACAQLVAPLKWSDVLSICGPEIELRARVVTKSYSNLLAQDIPDRLQFGSVAVIEAKNGYYKLHHPDMGLDAFQLSGRVMRLLHYFDGRPTPEVVNQIAQEERLRFQPELLRRLVDFRILKPAGCAK